MRIAPSIQLTEPERRQLAQWARGRQTPARVVLRAKIALLAAAGHDSQHLAAALGTSRQTWASGGTASPPSACRASPRMRPVGNVPPRPARPSPRAF